jgi:hypothetical protein
MKLYRLFTVTATAVALTTAASAQSKGAGAVKAPHVTASTPKSGGTITHGQKSGPSTSSGKANAGSSKTSTTTASTSRGNSDKSGKGSSHPKAATSTTPSTGTVATADATPPNPVSTKIAGNPAQLAKIQPQLDALGLTLEAATAGFRNQGQFIAALNAAKNRNLDFVALQEAMTVEGLSLGQAAKKLANTPPVPETPPAPASASTTAQ